MRTESCSTEDIRSMFDRISGKYDKLNTLLSLRLDRGWRKALLKSIPFGKGKILDCCTGTGELALLLAEKGHEVTGVDISASMLEKAQEKKGEKANPVFLEADVEALPFPDHSFQAITSAFSLRNLKNLEKCFGEAERVLAPGGTGLFLDLTMPGSWWLAPLHKFYLTRILPEVGGWVSGYRDAYHYLGRSILNFPHPKEIARKMEECGFSKIQVQPLSGGIATLWTARK